MTEQHQQLHEKFGILPVGLVQVDKIDGMGIYSSQRLMDQYLDAIMGQKLLKNAYMSIASLVRKGVIVPCFTSSGMISWMMHKAFANAIDKSAMGVYYPEKNTVYILMDNRIKFFIWTSNSKLSSVTIHELMHFFSQNQQKKFLGLFDQMLSTFYTEFFNIYFGSRVFDQSVGREFYQYLLEAFEWSETMKPARILQTAEFLDLSFSKGIRSQEQRQDFIVSMLTPIKMFLTNTDTFISMAQRDDKTRHLMRSLIRAYRILGIKNPDTTPIQELLYPSEVCAITSENAKAEHYIALKYLS